MLAHGRVWPRHWLLLCSSRQPCSEGPSLARNYCSVHASPSGEVADDGIRPFHEIPLASKRSAKKMMKQMLGLQKDVSVRMIPRQQEMYRMHGPIVRVQVPVSAQEQVFVFTPQDIEKVFRQADLNKDHAHRPINPSFIRILNQHKKKPGLFFSNGEDWYKYRRAIGKKMLRPLEIVKCFDDIMPIADEAVEKIKRDKVTNASDERCGEIVGLDNLLFKWSFESITKLLFHMKFNALSQNPPQEATEAIDAVGKFLYLLIESGAIDEKVLKFYTPQKLKNLEQSVLQMFHYVEVFAQRRLDEIVVHKGKDNGGGDLLSYLMSQDHLTPTDVFSSIVDTYLAGIDTTSNTMIWALYMLSRNPGAQQALRNELKTMVGSERPTKQHLQQLPYLKAVIKETLRLRTVVPFTARKLDSDIVLSGYHVPAGVIVSLVLHVTGTLDDQFDDPSAFKPERWLSKKETRHPFRHTPFGFGTRMCVGRRFAELELQLLLVRIMQSFELQYPQGENVGIRARAILTPDRDVRVKFVDL